MTLTQLFTSIANAIRSKKGTVGTIYAEDFPSEISSISTGITPTGTINITQNGITDVTNYASANVSVSGGGTAEKDVNFYDYDGALLHSYSKTEFLALTEMPANPTHTGLIAQGWNWDLTDAKSYVTDYGILDIGQTYTTSSGLSEFDIELTPATGLSVTLNMNGTKNWGDGTSNTNTSHTYTNYDNYTITCDGTTLNSGGLFGQSGSNINYYVTNIKLANITSILGTQTVANCYSLENILISKGITALSNYFAQYCMSLKALIIPDTITTLGTYTCSNCIALKVFVLTAKITNTTDIIISAGTCQNDYSLTKIIIPENATRIAQNGFDDCFTLTKIIIPKNVNYIGRYAFRYNYNNVLYDFSNVISIPTLQNIDAFLGLNKIAKIIVPDSLYSTWITTTNWTNYTDYIIKESDYNAS